MFRKAVLTMIVGLVLFGALTACVGEDILMDGREDLTFFAKLEVNRKEEVVIDLGIQTGVAPVAADEDFEGRWEITDMAGNPRAAGEVFEIDRLAADSERVLLSWSGHLEPAEHELAWGAPGYGQTHVRFELREVAGEVVLGDVTVTQDGDILPRKQPLFEEQ